MTDTQQIYSFLNDAGNGSSLVANNHVVEKASQVEVVLTQGDRHTAEAREQRMVA